MITDSDWGNCRFWHM